MPQNMKSWLQTLATVLAENKDAYFYYTTSDDGVWLEYGADAPLCLEFNHDSAVKALRDAAGQAGSATEKP